VALPRSPFMVHPSVCDAPTLLSSKFDGIYSWSLPCSQLTPVIVYIVGHSHAPNLHPSQFEIIYSCSFGRSYLTPEQVGYHI
jgi:hypothetical protein